MKKWVFIDVKSREGSFEISRRSLPCSLSIILLALRADSFKKDTMPLNVKSGLFACGFVQSLTVGHREIHDSAAYRTGKMIVRLKLPIISVDSMHFHHGNLMVLHKNIKISIYCAAADFVIDAPRFQVNLIGRRVIGMLVHQIQNHLSLFGISALFQEFPTSFPIDHTEKDGTRSKTDRPDTQRVKFFAKA